MSLEYGTDVRSVNIPITFERGNEGILPIDAFTKTTIDPITVEGMGTSAIQKPIEEKVLMTATTEVLEKPKEEMKVEEKVVCKRETPKGLSDEDMNQTLLNILLSKGPGISCACDAWDFYPLANPSEGEYTWKSGAEIVYRESEKDSWMSTKDYRIKYSRWSPKYSEDSFRKPQRVILLHDAIDSRKAWWCVQKLLSPFFDTVSIDLLGSGESMKPRGLKQGGNFPWLYEAHALYLNDMAGALWPGDDFYVAGVGWGAQIAACMASGNQRVKGFIMINPPGFVEKNHPEAHYLDFYHLRGIESDEQFNKLPTCMTSRARDILVLGLSSSDTGFSGRDSATATNIKLLLEQYMSLDRQRVFIDQMVSISKHTMQEFPKTKGNPLGLKVDNIKAPCLVISGGNDIFYPPEHRNLYPYIYYKSVVETSYFKELGHFAHIEDPKLVAEAILDFIREKSGVSHLQMPFIGFLGGSQGNEISIMRGLKSLYNFEK